MKIAEFFSVLSLLLSCGTGLAAIPPWYPPLRPAAPSNTVIPPEKIQFTLASGERVAMAEFLKKRSLNGNWKFSGIERGAVPFPDESGGVEAAAFDDSGWDTIAVPLNWYRKYPKVYDRKQPYNRGFYRHEFSLTAEELKQYRILLHFQFIGYEATLWINGRRAGMHHGDFIPWLVDITDFATPGKNQLTLRVTQDFGTTHGDIPRATRTYGSQWSPGNIKGGIWGDVELCFAPQVRMKKFFVTPLPDGNELLLDLTLENKTGTARKASLAFAVTDAMRKAPNRKIGETRLDNLTLPAGSSRFSTRLRVKSPEHWSPASPHLYFANAVLLEEGKITAARAERFGFRNFEIRNGEFHLNGERIYLFGENIPSVNFGGFGRSSAQEAERLREWLSGYKARGCNILRNAHMPIMKEALEIADEIGIMFYNEWSWSFIREIAEPEFQRRNDRELLAWLERDCNHPSVVMWSCGNEVRHAQNPPVYRQLNRQVELLRRSDPQRRPVGSFSGSANYANYGSDPLTTDFLDLHSYVGCGNEPWTCWVPRNDGIYRKLLEIYQTPGTRLKMPYIIWESVGFSWGGRTDRSFQPNDTARYAAYVKKPTSWAAPNGVGFIGSLGLAAALDPDRGLNYGKRLYGHRILELQRQDPRIAGIAPWFHGYDLDAATLWNQPILPGLRNYEHHQPPRNLFAGKSLNTELFVVNSSGRPVRNAEFSICFLLPDQRRVTGARFPIKEVPAFSLHTEKVSIPIPPEPRGNCQLRIQLTSGGREIGRNFYNIFLAEPDILRTAIPHSGTIALLDAGNPRDVEETARLLRGFQIRYKVVRPDTPLNNFRTAVIPAGVHNTLPLKLNREALFHWMEKEGGTLLALEQNARVESLIHGTTLLDAPQTITDLVHPAHPVFAGLEPENFDTWENPELGYTVNCPLSPFLVNALATRGALLGGRGVDTVILEAGVGRGRLFLSQLNAVRLAERDGVAATYLHNLFDYLLNQPRYGKITKLTAELQRAEKIDPKKLISIDLTSHANRSFTDETENDGKGGWTDQGRNDFRNMPLGRQTAGGVEFNIIDPAGNGGRSCLVLRGSERPQFPSEITGIAVRGRYTRLFFLHTAAWSTGEVGIYRIHYADGGTVDVPIRHGINIGDWWNTTYLENARPGIMRPNSTRNQVGTYVATWDNPHPEKEITSFDFLSIVSPLVKGINFNPSQTAVPVLIAVTGEKTNPARVRIGSRFAGGHDGKVEQDKAVVTEINTTLPDGTAGRVHRVEMKTPRNGTPFVIAWFDPAGVNLNDCEFITFFVRAETPGMVDLRLPDADWKTTLRVNNIALSGGEWHKVRIPLATADKQRLAGKKLRGELLFFNTARKVSGYTPGPIRFLITGIALE